ncbi:MAG: DnaD domain protein [Chloroflexi bacterium]|nr:DnaD domain protein [Chloroflexota bacterium]
MTQGHPVEGPPFEGFVAGGAATTLPSQFFTEVLPRIDDEAELRVTLYTLYAIGRRRGPLRAVRASQLATEEPLRRALAGCGGHDALGPGIERASARGSLLTLALDDGDTLCFVNDESGRRSLDRVRSGATPLPDGARPRARPGAPVGLEVSGPAQVYEQEIGLLTPSTSEALGKACERYTEEWVTDALREAARNNARSWAYAEAILRRWEREGKDEGSRSTRDASAQGAAASAARDHGPYERVIRRS